MPESAHVVHAIFYFKEIARFTVRCFTDQESGLA